MTTVSATKGQKFTITHTDGYIANEVISKIELVKEKNRVNVYNDNKVIINSFFECSKYQLIICESGASYTADELKNIL